MTIMDALRIMCEHFDDDNDLGSYIRMLTNIPSGELDLGDTKMSFSEQTSFDDLLRNTGLKRSEDG